MRTGKRMFTPNPREYYPCSFRNAASGKLVANLSLEERLPTAFYPVSAPPYMNGGPVDFLYWIIDSKDPSFTPDKAKKWLEGRLPNPVDDLDEWATDD